MRLSKAVFPSSVWLVGKQEVIESMKRLAHMTEFPENGVFKQLQLSARRHGKLPKTRLLRN